MDSLLTDLNLIVFLNHTFRHTNEFSYMKNINLYLSIHLASQRNREKLNESVTVRTLKYNNTDIVEIKGRSYSIYPFDACLLLMMAMYFPDRADFCDVDCVKDTASSAVEALLTPGGRQARCLAQTGFL